MRTGILRPGDKAFDFTRGSRFGTVVSPANFAAKQNIVLLFYRGMW
ncbi:MAG: hypothetical protein ACR2H4_07415 [Pyrinomonadaceae bacterium]